MNFCRIFFIIFFVSTSAISNEKIPVKYIDLNYIVNNSIVGKKIKDLIIKEKTKLEKEHQNIETKLLSKKNDILSKKNVLSEEEFKKIAKKNPNFVQSFLYLYEIAKLRENKQDIAKYKSIVFSLDETIAIE